MDTWRIMLLGATGRTGLQFLERALKKGHTVKILVRDTGNVHPEHCNLIAMKGSPLDSTAGPFEKYTGNPVIDKSHEVLVWRQNGGIACLASISCTLAYAADGLDFMGGPLNIPVERKQRPNAPGAFRKDLTAHESGEDGMSWGISMVHNGKEPYLLRWQKQQ